MSKPVWDKSIAGLHPALASLKPSKAELAALEEIRAMRAGMGASALTEDQKWHAAQMSEVEFTSNNIAAFEQSGIKSQVLIHKRRKARALRNLGRFDEALALITTDGRAIRGSAKLRNEIIALAEAVQRGDEDCGCERETMSYTDGEANLQREITIEPNRTHRAERVVLDGKVRWTYRCSLCGWMNMPDSLPSRHQEIHKQRTDKSGKTDVELLKAG